MVTKTDGFEFTIENAAKFESLIEEAGVKISDFSPVFLTFSASWFKRRERIFMLSTEGKYAPLGGFNHSAPSGFGTQTKRQRAESLKQQKVGRSWAPILRGTTDKLMTATTGGHGSILRIKPKQLRMGVDGRTVPYAKYHNSEKARKTLPKRKMVFLSGGKDKAQDAIVGNDIQAFTVSLESHVTQKLKGTF